MRTKASLFAASVFPLMLSAQSAFAQGYDHMGYGVWFFMPGMMAIIAGLTIGAIVVVVRMFGPGAGSGASRKAQDLLDERFARGEIDKEEYIQRRDALDR